MNVAGYAAVKSLTWVDANVALNAIIVICKGHDSINKNQYQDNMQYSTLLLIIITSTKNHHQKGRHEFHFRSQKPNMPGKGEAGFDNRSDCSTDTTQRQCMSHHCYSLAHDFSSIRLLKKESEPDYRIHSRTLV